MLIVTIPFTQVEAAAKGTTITVQGTSQLDAVPDIAYIGVAVVTSAATVAEAQSENARLANQVYAHVEAAGIEKEYIKTAQFNVVPIYQQEEGKWTNVPAIQGYQITNGITVTVVPARAGEIIDIALQAGANQVNSVRFGKLDEAGLKNTTVQMAVKDAMAKAEAIAATFGKRVIRVQSVNETGVYLQMPEVGNRYQMKAADSAPTPITPGLIHLTANVQLVVETN
jgi:uncharacterized protein